MRLLVCICINFQTRKKDWPPTAGFEDVFPDLYKSFMAAVPMKEYTHADGSLNLASNFPRNTVYPDLGGCDMSFRN